MPVDATDLASHILQVLWACLNVSTWINQRFVHVLSSQDRLTALFTLAGFTFCPGLLDALRAAAPPSIRWFESLDTAVPKNIWGVYAMVLRKPGHKPLLYIGSGTGRYRGARARLSEHRRGVNTPRYVARALRDGYKLNHIALLAYCPLPATADLPTVRTIVLALEAAFSCVFWAMRSRTTSYGYGHLCPWDRQTFKYDGLCSHSALVDPLLYSDEELDFTPEQLEQMAVAVSEKNRRYMQEYGKAQRKNPTEEYKASQAAKNAKQRPATKAKQQAAVENQLHRCSLCDINAHDNASLLIHYDTKGHKRKLEFGDTGPHYISGDARALRRLRTACERAKRTLSNGTQTTIEIDSLFDGEDFNSNITRARFEEINGKAFNGTMQPVEQVLKDANIERSKVDEIVLVGGSTRIPRIQKLLSDFFNGKKLEKSINPDEAVAYGAAVQAGILSGKATSADTADVLLLDVVPLSLGVAMEGNIFAPVVPRGQTVPTIKKRTFTTVADNQQTVQFPVFQGERVNCEDNTSLGEFTLAPIPAMKAGDAVLEVVFEVDVNGILKVTATEKTSGRSANITISNSVGKLSSGEIEKMVEEAAKFKGVDDAFSKKFEARQQLESYISRVEEIVSDPTMSMKLKRGQKEKIESALSDAMAQLEIEDAGSDDLRKKELALKRVVTKAISTR